MAEFLKGVQLGAPGRAESAAATGKGTPAGGSDLPAVRQARTPDLSQVVENLNEFLRNNRRNIQFRIDEGRTIVTVVDASTGETVRQIPSEAVLALSRHLRRMGMLLDLHA